MNILLTGSTGFNGSRLAEQIATQQKFSLTCAVRQSGMVLRGREAVVGSLANDIDWSAALNNQSVVVHAAARNDIMAEEVSDPMVEYRKVNVDGTLNLARQAAKAGVSRFVYISSIKVNGELTLLGNPFTAEDVPAPEDPYGASKLEAETCIKAIASETGMSVVIIRPPLVYGPGVKGNFAAIVRLVQKGLPLPLGSIHNQRSLVALDNLVDLIITCIDHPAAADQIFLAGDGQDVSTTELLQGIGHAMGKPARLIPISSTTLMFCAGLLGRKAIAQRLLGSLQVDISNARKLLDWEPPLTVEEGLRRCFGSENSS